MWQRLWLHVAMKFGSAQFKVKMTYGKAVLYPLSD